MDLKIQKKSTKNNISLEIKKIFFLNAIRFFVTRIISF